MRYRNRYHNHRPTSTEVSGRIKGNGFPATNYTAGVTAVGIERKTSGSLEKNTIWTRFPVAFATALFCCILWGSASPAIKIAYQLFRIPADDTGRSACNTNFLNDACCSCDRQNHMNLLIFQSFHKAQDTPKRCL